MKTNLTEGQVKALFYAGVSILALYVIYKFAKGLGDTAGSIFEGIGVSDTKEEKKVKSATDKALEDFKKEANKTSKPTRTDSAWTLVANSIYDALKRSAIDDNKTFAYTQLARILTDADMGAVLVAFGRRQEYAFGIPMGEPKTLVDFVKDNFNQKDIDDLNNLYAKSKMRFKF
jgi:hypothetical protein